SVSFSPDGTHIVSGSDDNTVRLWDLATAQQLHEILYSPYMDSTSSLLPHSPASTPAKSEHISFSLRFSANPKYTLHDSTQLLSGLQHGINYEQSFILQSDGWMLGPGNRLLFWVPPASQSSFHYNLWCKLVIGKKSVEVDMSHMEHGRQWDKCYVRPTKSR
ncbi:hypothetical protein BJ138DRAFT_233485, partial [Hygrophoropsis aurantiaca]